MASHPLLRPRPHLCIFFFVCGREPHLCFGFQDGEMDVVRYRTLDVKKI